MKQTADFRTWLVLAGFMVAGVSGAAAEKKVEPASVQSPETMAWQLLSAEVHSKNSQHRQAAMIGLSIIKSSTRALKMAEQGLKDEDESVRQMAIAALQQMGSKRALPSLRSALDDESGQVRFEAAKALWAMGDHSGRSVLLQVLEGQSSPSKGAVKSGLEYANKELHDPKALAGKVLRALPMRSWVRFRWAW